MLWCQVWRPSERLWKYTPPKTDDQKNTAHWMESWRLSITLRGVILPSSPPDGRAPVSTMSLFHRSLWHLQKSDESQQMITDYCEPNWGGAPSQLPGNCCTYHAPIDREDLAGRVISNSSHSPGMNNSTFVILTQGHVNILMIKGLGLPGTSAETHSGLLYWWPL